MARSLEAQEAEYEEFEAAEQGTDEWHEQRRPWINTSSCAALFGESPYMSLGDLCTEKLAGREPVTEAKQGTYDRGHRWENYVADETQREFGWRLYQPSVMFRRGPLLSNPDRLVRERDDVLVECKSAREFLGPVVRRDWWWQVQGELWCTDRAMGIVAALDSSLDVQFFEIDRDDDAIRRLVDRAESILQALQWDEMPVGVPLSAENVGRLWPRDSGAEVPVDDSALKIVRAYVHAREEKKRWEDEQKRLKNELVSQIGSGSFAVLRGTQVASFKATKDKDVLDWRRMAAENPELAKKYTQTVPGARTFRPATDKVLAALGMETDDDEDW